MVEIARMKVIRHFLVALATTSALLCSSVSFANDSQWDDWDEEPLSPWTINSYGQLTLGQWTQSRQADTSWSSQQFNVRGEADYQQDFYKLSLKSDFSYDAIDSGFNTKVRELNFKLDFANLDSDSPILSNKLVSNLAINIGRQSLSWGVGDFVFINDLFAKNWQAFFYGQEDQYLKQPNDAIKLSYFTSAINLDVIHQPRSNSDVLINAHQLKQHKGSTTNARLYLNHQQVDYAVYASNGWATSPIHINGHLEYVKRKSLGASLLTPWLSGLFKLEMGRYWLDSQSGKKQQQNLLLIGFEQELKPRLSLALQAYLEQDSNSYYLDNRQMLTSQLRYLSKNSNWNSQIMVFYSPNHHDHYLRASSSYRHDDHINLTFGLNILHGVNESLFGSLSAQDNVYLRFTYYF